MSDLKLILEESNIKIISNAFECNISSRDVPKFNWILGGLCISETDAASGLFGTTKFPSLLDHMQDLLPSELKSKVAIVSSDKIPLEFMTRSLNVRGFSDAIFIPIQNVGSSPIKLANLNLSSEQQKLIEFSTLCHIEWKTPSTVHDEASDRQSILELLSFKTDYVTKPFTICTDLSSCMKIWIRVNSTCVTRVITNGIENMSLEQGLPIMFELLNVNYNDFQAKLKSIYENTEKDHDFVDDYEEDDCGGGSDVDDESNDDEEQSMPSPSPSRKSPKSKVTKRQKMNSTLLQEDAREILSPDEEEELDKSITKHLFVERMCEKFPARADYYRSNEFLDRIIVGDKLVGI